MVELEIEEEEKKQEFVTIAFKVPKNSSDDFKKLLKKAKHIVKKEGKQAKNWIAVYEALSFFCENKKKIEEMHKLEEESKKIEEEIKYLKELLPSYLKNKIAIVKKEGYIQVLASKKALGKWYDALKIILKEVGFRFDWNSYSWVKPVTLGEEQIAQLFSFKRPENLPEKQFTPKREKSEMVYGWKIVRGKDGLLWAVKNGEWRPLGLQYFDRRIVEKKIESWEKPRYIY